MRVKFGVLQQTHSVRLPAKFRLDRFVLSSSGGKKRQFLPAALHAAQACWYLIYSESDFEVFRPAGATRCTDGGEIWHREGAPPPCQISPHRCNDKGVVPQKLKFLLTFDRNVEYKRPAGAYPLRDFHKICKVCTSFKVR